MTDFLPESLDGLLVEHAKVLDEEQSRSATFEQRIYRAADLIITSTGQGVRRYIGEGVRLEEGLGKPSRAYVAGVLSLIGQSHFGFGYASTDEVVLARNINRHNVIFFEARAVLDNIHFEPFESSEISIEQGFKNSHPDEIVEATARLLATQREEDPAEEIGSIGAWLSNDPMPEQPYQSRSNYVAPALLGRVAQAMLRAMKFPALNPQLYKFDFVRRISIPLAEAVADLTIETKDFPEILVLPSWLQSPAGQAPTPAPND